MEAGELATDAFSAAIARRSCGARSSLAFDTSKFWTGVLGDDGSFDSSFAFLGEVSGSDWRRSIRSGSARSGDLRGTGGSVLKVGIGGRRRDFEGIGSDRTASSPSGLGLICLLSDFPRRSGVLAVVLSWRKGSDGSGISSVVDGTEDTTFWLPNSVPAVADRRGASGRRLREEIVAKGDNACDVVLSSFDRALTSFFDENSRRKKPGLGFGLTASCVKGSVGTGGTTSDVVGAMVAAVPGLEGVRDLLPPGVPGGVAPGVLGRSKPGNTGNGQS